MKKLIFVGILGLFVLGSCNNSTVTHTHNEHDHATEGHNHEAEGSNHSHEGECSGEHNHEATDGHNESAEAHSDEIILPKVKAEAAGVKVSIIEPAPFQQVIKTSGQVLAAQGDESVAVATVAGVVSFRGKVTEGMHIPDDPAYYEKFYFTPGDIGFEPIQTSTTCPHCLRGI